MNDVLFFVAGPRYIFLAMVERSTYRMHARHHALIVLIDLSINRQSHTGHDAHVNDDVWRIRELNPDLRHRRADWPHAERQHVHSATLHGSVEKLLQFSTHLVGLFPIVGWASAIPRERADEGAIFDPR